MRFHLANRRSGFRRLRSTSRSGGPPMRALTRGTYKSHSITVSPHPEEARKAVSSFDKLRMRGRGRPALDSSFETPLRGSSGRGRDFWDRLSKKRNGTLLDLTPIRGDTAIRLWALGQ